MPRQNYISTLADYALAELSKIIVHTIGSEVMDEDLALVVIQSYLSECGATPNIYQDLLHVVLYSESLEASIRFGCLRILLNESVQSLVTEIFPFSYYEKILKVISEQGLGLRYLNLKGVWVKDEHMNYMFDIVRRLKHLTNLTIPYIANDDLLEEIGKTCQNIKILDIAGETDITDLGLHAISTGVCTKLTYIDIGMLREETICHEDIALLIENLPCLLKIVTYSYVGRSIRFIHKKNPNFRCKLQYIHDTDTSFEALDSIVECCPDVNNIYLDTPAAGILHKLINLRRLEQLKLFKFSCDELMTDLLPKMGYNLQILTLIKGRGQCDLGALSKRCPLIVELECYLMELLTYACDGVFPMLQGLEFLNSCMNNFSLKSFIIGHARTIKRLGIDTVTFQDEDIKNIFMEHDFNELQDLWFTSAPNLTLHSVDILMSRLSELKSLGQLTGWALDPDDLEFLRGVVKSQNTRLSLSPGSIFSM